MAKKSAILEKNQLKKHKKILIVDEKGLARNEVVQDLDEPIKNPGSHPVGSSSHTAPIIPFPL